MSEQDKPLHVLVAAALGWSEFQKEGGILLPGTDNWSGWPADWLPIVGKGRPRAMVPRYDTDWSATGPLIEKYLLCLTPYEGSDGNTWWMAIPGRHPSKEEGGHGRTPLEAACSAILALKEAGKL